MSGARHIASALRLGLIAGLGALVLIQASCADSEEERAPSPEAGVDDSGLPARADAGVDAPDGDAGEQRLPCETVDWCPVETGVDSKYTLTAVWGASNEDIWAVGSGGTVVRWDGAAWNVAKSATLNTLLGVWGSGPKDVWAVGSGAAIVHSTDGTSFAPVPFEGERPSALSRMSIEQVFDQSLRLHTVLGWSASEVRLAGAPFRLTETGGSCVSEDGCVRGEFSYWRKTTSDGSARWQWLTNPKEVSRFTARGMWGASSNDVWLVGRDGIRQAEGVTLHETGTGAGRTFVSVDSQTSLPLNAIWGSSAGDVWAVGALGTIRRYTAGASRFAIVESPVTVDLNAVWGTGPNDVWAVGDGGTVLHFDGVAWTISTTAFGTGPAPNLSGVWGSGPNDVWAVGGAIALHFTGHKPGIDGGKK